MGNNDRQERREYDPRDYPGVEPGLQIITPTPREEEERRDGWRPEYGDVSKIIRNNRLPSINPTKPIIH